MQVGDVVQVAAHADVDLRGRVHVVADSVTWPVSPYHADFVRTGPTKAGHYLFWQSGCMFVTLDSAGTSAVPFASVQSVVDASIETWNTDTVTATCSYMVMQNAGTKASEVGNDGVNLIKFRDDDWCRPAVDNDPKRCYDASAAGITTAIFIDDASSKNDGAIQDADVEINGVNFAISVAGATASTEACHAELQNTLTHELGHVHGLEHTCRVDTDPPRVDNTGSAVPLCSDTAALAANPSIADATMFPFQDCGETKKETLANDDIDAMCTVYPVASDPHSCSPVAHDAGGCCQAGGGGGGPLAVGAMTMFLLGRRRRVRSPR
jgi:uncharacterized protein (TIGR03382 family)